MGRRRRRLIRCAAQVIPPDIALGIISGAGRSPAALASAYLMRPHAQDRSACSGSLDHSCFAQGTVRGRRRRGRRRRKKEGRGGVGGGGGGRPVWIPRLLLPLSLISFACAELGEISTERQSGGTAGEFL